ncbi:hypothetical protein [Myroides fluvii]|uniref:hypothetical protein n=1 Tax=Myroides fluvii TaxID=2572594 RepID=UPI00131A7C0A|nr:hypothetical protein [Myroides fluvii]
MKTVKILKNMGLVLFLGLLITACSSDDNKGSGENAEHFKNVPKGEIVPTAKRFVTLTGYEENTGRGTAVATLNTNTQKWWKYTDGKIIYHCDGIDEVDDAGESGDYFAFSPDGILYYKYGANGTPEGDSNWRWTDSSKSKIIVSAEGEDSMVYEFTALNPNLVVYATYLTEGNCSLLAWVRLGSN